MGTMDRGHHVTLDFGDVLWVKGTSAAKGFVEPKVSSPDGDV